MVRVKDDDGLFEYALEFWLRATLRRSNHDEHGYGPGPWGRWMVRAHVCAGRRWKATVQCAYGWTWRWDAGEWANCGLSYVWPSVRIHSTRVVVHTLHAQRWRKRRNRARHNARVTQPDREHCVVESRAKLKGGGYWVVSGCLAVVKDGVSEEVTARRERLFRD